MSTLTKILIVLLTISSIFLCGIVVTYVGTATNYKKAWEDRRSEIAALKAEKDDLNNKITALNETINSEAAKHTTAIDSLQSEISQLTTERNQYQNELKNAQAKIETNASILASNTQTVADNNRLRKEAQDRVAELEKLKTKYENDIQQLTSEIVSKNAIIDQYATDQKQLTEEKTQLQNRLDLYLQQVGKTSGAPTAVTASTGQAQVAPPIKDLNLEGRITEVKPENSLASISIGSANGVKDNMRFHVIHNGNFICDIIILQADADQASGYLDLVNETLPRAGDIVKTNF